jgi:RNA polymerase sigma-70 factor (ECF subfamily)
MVYQKLNQYSGGGSFLGWATTIALRIAGEELRRAHWHSPRLSFDQDAGSTADSAGSFPHPEPADPKAVPPERHVQLQAVLQLIEQALQAECSEQQRRAFLARFVDGHTYDDIAATLNISSSAVYQTIHQARRKLKQRLLEAGYQVEEFL